jgi:hypothetical protein
MSETAGTKTAFEQITIICEKLVLNFCIFYNAYLCTYFSSGTFTKFGLFILCFIIECVISSQIYTKLSNGEYTKVCNELQNDILIGKDYHESYTKLKTIWTNPTGNSQFETIKYNEIYQAIIKRLISKYKMKKLVI